MCLWMTEVVVVVYWLTHSTEKSWSVDSNPTHRHITSKMAYLSTESHNADGLRLRDEIHMLRTVLIVPVCVLLQLKLRPRSRFPQCI